MINIYKVYQRLVEQNLCIEEFDVVNGTLQHGNRVHLAPTRDHALKDLEPVTDSVPSFSGCHALWISGKPHSSSSSFVTFPHTFCLTCARIVDIGLVLAFLISLLAVPGNL